MYNRYSQKKMFAFDVDGTLTESRQEITAENALALAKLLFKKRAAIITGGTFERINEQVLRPLEKICRDNKQELRLENITLLPTNGAGLYVYDKKWIEKKSQKLSLAEKEKITNALNKIDREDPELANNSPFGDEIQDRGSEITYSALGDKAPLDLKKNWDPDFAKRLKLQDKLRLLLPDFEVKIGGTTSIDITQKGMDKAYAIRQIMSEYSLEKKDILFFGDAVYPNGNDYPVFLMGVDTIKVSSQTEVGPKILEAIN
jgi:phosphomannomutase